MKKIFVLSFITAGFFLRAQSIGNSPYAAYGIGDVKYDNTVETSAMGGISTAYIWDFNNRFNFANPAANTNLELATISIEGSNENNFYTSDYNDYKKTKHSTYLSNISIAFPLAKQVKFGMGYQPYSSKKYDILSSSTENEVTKANYFQGKGTLNLVQAALSYQITPNFGLGMRTNFYFGKLYDIEEMTYSNADLINGFENSTKVKAFNFTAGTVYQKKFENDRKLTLGATYTFGSVGTMDTAYKNSTYYTLADGSKANESVIDKQTGKNKNLLPEKASIGIGYGHDTKWFASTQFDYKNGETIQYLGQPYKYENSYRISAGGWMLPNYNNFRNYFSRVTYRFGAYYEKGDIYAKAITANSGQSINKFALTAGMSLPYERSNATRMSGVDLGLEVGKRGTKANDLINQTFVNFKVGINFADKWFSKRYFD